jgi:DNA-directed RNA polymerase subunit RPC12/RpoP
MLHVPTTDEMDHTTSEERRKLVAMCDACGEWLHFLRKEGSMYATTGLSCENCGGKSFHGLISERTFDVERAKKETAKWLKAHKK